MGFDKEKEFEKYYVKYYRQVYAYLARKITDHYAAEDLAMDAFYACWEKFDTFDESKASFQTWLFVIANNRLKNYYRDHKISDELDDNMTAESNMEDELMQSVYLQQMRDRLYEAMEVLNENQRAIVIYKYFKNKDSTEIAEIMGITPGNARIQLKRAMDKIRDYFEKNNIRWE